MCLSSRAGRGWEQRLRLWRSDPRERTGSDCHEDNLRGLYDTAEGVHKKNLGLPGRQEIIIAGKF